MTVRQYERRNVGVNTKIISLSNNRRKNIEDTLPVDDDPLANQPPNGQMPPLDSKEIHYSANFVTDIIETISCSRISSQKKK